MVPEVNAELVVSVKRDARDNSNSFWQLCLIGPTFWHLVCVYLISWGKVYILAVGQPTQFITRRHFTSSLFCQSCFLLKSLKMNKLEVLFLRQTNGFKKQPTIVKTWNNLHCPRITRWPLCSSIPQWSRLTSRTKEPIRPGSHFVV